MKRCILQPLLHCIKCGECTAAKDRRKNTDEEVRKVIDNLKPIKGLSIVGAKRNDGERETNDFYPTPPSATMALLEREKFDGNIWECACGKGAISEVLIENGYDVISTDLIERGYGIGNIDFMQNDLFQKLEMQDNIITNPPFKYALEFVMQAKKIARNKIAFLLKTVFLESVVRYDMFQDTEFPLKTVYQFSRRLILHKYGTPKPKGGGLVCYAWFVWDKNYKGKPMIEWIK